MNPMNRLCVLALLVILGGLFAASPTLADKPHQYDPYLTTTVRLVPPAIDPPKPQASGKSIVEEYIRGVSVGDYSWYCLWSDVIVTCTKLTPGKQYHIRWVGEESGWGSCSSTADARGRLRAEFWVDDWFTAVWVENDEGDVVLAPQEP